MFFRNRAGIAAGLLAWAGTALGADAPRLKVFEPIELRLSPGPATVPALKYRLLPLHSELNPGNAAPIYLRLSAEQPEKPLREIRQKAAAWFDLPIDKLPIAEVREYLDSWKKKFEQLDFGARRQTCEWNYSLPEQRENAIEILLPDVQESRHWASLLALKARLEIAEHKFDDAVRTLETGFAYSRHVGEGPFLISSLVAIAETTQMLHRVEELIAQPDAPNLYWALSALPRPPIGLRHGLENEEKMFEWVVPEVTGLDRPHTEAEWSSRLAALHARLSHLAKTGNWVDGKPVPIGHETTLAQFKAENLPDARAFFKDRRPPAAVAGMTDDQMLIRFIAERARALRDDQYKYTYLTFPEAVRFDIDRTVKELASIQDGPFAVLGMLTSSLRNYLAAGARLERAVAALRIVEAIRIQAHQDGGKLPDSLDQVTVVPVPLDPVTGKPFSARREGDVFILSGPPPFPEMPGLTYRITLRK